MTPLSRLIAALLALVLSAAVASTAAAAPTVDEFDVPTAGGGPTDIVRGPDGNLWYVEQSEAKVGRVIPGNPPTITDFDSPKEAGMGGTQISGLQNINVGPDGNIWISGTNRVAKIPPGNPDGGVAYGGLGLI